MFFGKFLRSKAFEIIFMIFVIASMFYVTNRLSLLIEAFFNINPSLVIFIILVVLLGYMLLYIKSKKEIKRTRNLYEFCSVIVCFLLHFVMSLWIYDILNLFLKLNDKWYLLVVIIAIIITFYGFIHAKKLDIKEYDLKLNKNKKLALISDIHAGKFVDFKQLSKIVNKINELDVDYLLIAGDLFDVDAYEYCNKDEIIKILNKLKVKEKMYAILGNHDPSSKTNIMREFYNQTKIKLLIDEINEENDIIFIGRDDITTNPKRLALNQLIKDNHKLKIVLDHNPLGIDEAITNNIDIILMGHTHKGQFFPANIFTKLAYGDSYYGYHIKDNTHMITSSGAGYFQMPMRTLSNSEIVLINI